MEPDCSQFRCMHSTRNEDIVRCKVGNQYRAICGEQETSVCHVAIILLPVWILHYIHYLQCSNDALHMRVITGDMTSSTLLSSHVGTGSRMQCFAGAFSNDRFTSSEVTGLNAARGSGTERVLMIGGGAPVWYENLSGVVSCPENI